MCETQIVWERKVGMWPGGNPGTSEEGTVTWGPTADWKKKESEVAQSCPTLCNPMDCKLPGSSVHGILQARILEWVAISFSKGPFQPRDQTQVARIAGRRFTVWAMREARLGS